MHFLYNNNGLVTQGDLTIIPDEYKTIALIQKRDSIIAYNLNWICYPIFVDQNKTIEYIPW